MPALTNARTQRIARRVRRVAFRTGDTMQREARPDDWQAAAPIVSVKGLGKTYASGFQALKRIDLDIRRGEILALLGPNGAGKTTLISMICGIVTPSEGTVTVNG